MVAAVDFDEAPTACADERATDEFGSLSRIDTDRERAELGERAQPLCLRADGPDRIADEQIGAAGRGEHLGFADRRDGQPDCPEFELPARDLDALMRLRVRAQRKPAVGR